MNENGTLVVMERTFIVPLEANEEGRILEGCVLPYGEAQKVRDAPDGPAYWERFDHGVFRKQMDPGAAQRIELVAEHEPGMINSVGICRDFNEQAHGLFGTFAMHASAFGDHALAMVRSKVFKGFSVSFSDRFTHWRRDGETVVRQSCVLHHVGLVREPAYAAALITGMRSRQQLLERLELPEIPDEQLERLRAVGIAV